MVYDGLGDRLSMTAWVGGESATTQYELEGGRVLTATAGELSTSYLYGMGPVAELTDSWAYSLPDGTNTQRQLTDSAGEVTLISSYTPWGDTLTSHGSGSFTNGYFGGIMDNATGLLYVGNGQYYDPATGRFLNRNARPEQSNPYVPWKSDPTGALISPLVLLALIFANKKKHGKWDNLFILLVLCIALGMSLSACNPEVTPTQEDDTGINTVGNPPFPLKLHFIQGGEVIAYYSFPGGTAVNLPTIECWITLKDADDTIITNIETTILDRNILSGKNPHYVSGNWITALNVYDYYRDLVEPSGKIEPGWWMNIFGSFTFFDYLSLLVYYESSYEEPMNKQAIDQFESSHQYRVAQLMAEAGVRWYNERTPLYYGEDIYGLIDWWTAFSQSQVTRALSYWTPPESNNKSKILEFKIVGQYFENSINGSFTSGKMEDSPYGWGNASAWDDYNVKAPSLFKGRRDNHPIIFFYIDDLIDPFYIPSGCAVDKWVDSLSYGQEACD